MPLEIKGRPWTHPELKHGINLLASEVALNCYMSAYGDMHATKCRAAMMNFPFNDIQGTIEIVDWGCGQGIGSATIIEVLRQRDMLQWLRKVTLIEPSLSAIERANDSRHTFFCFSFTLQIYIISQTRNFSLCLVSYHIIIRQTRKLLLNLVIYNTITPQHFGVINIFRPKHFGKQSETVLYRIPIRNICNFP